MKRSLSCLILCLSFTLACQAVQKSETVAPEKENTASQSVVSINKNLDTNVEKPILVGPANSEEKTAIDKQFRAFKNAVLNYKGHEAAEFLSKESLDYYQHLMDLAHAQLIDADNYAVQSQKLSPSVRTNVALMASRIGPELLKNANPKEIYALAFKEGWIGYNSFITASIDRINQYTQGNEKLIIADFYYDGVLKDGQVPRIAFRFQDGAWRIDLTPLFVAVDMVIQKYIEDEQLELEGSIDLTIQESNDALKPSKWIFYKDENHDFAIKFPHQPLYTFDAPYHSFRSETALNLFGVLLRDYDAKDEPNPLNDENVQDYEVHNLFEPLGIDDNQCTKAQGDKLLRFSCKFSSKTNDIRGKADFYFLDKKVYIVYAVSQSSSFSEKLAQSFLQHFLVF